MSDGDKILLLRAIEGTGGRYGINLPVDVLRGAKHAKIAGKYDQLEVHGKGRHGSVDHWKEVARSLEDSKLVKRRCVGGKGFGRKGGITIYSLSDSGKLMLNPSGAESNSSQVSRGLPKAKAKAKARAKAKAKADSSLPPSQQNSQGMNIATPHRRRPRVPNPEVPVAPIDPEKDGLKPPEHAGKIEAPSALPSELEGSLMPFQRAGVAFAIRRGGRCLIGDDMGLGKTIQAISVCCAFRNEWPVVVVVPNSLRYVWAEELERWIPDIGPQGVKVVKSGRDVDGFTSGVASFYIVSYGLLARANLVRDHLREAKLKFVVVDESHMIKNRDALRTKEVLCVVQEASRVLLLSGTPALARPVELFTQVQAVEPSLFPSFNKYAQRYCNPRRTPYGYDYGGAAHLDELHAHLRPIMVRRFKKDVLDELPSKRRQRIPLEVDTKVLEPLRREQARVEDPKEKQKILMQMYAATAEAKLDAACEYVEDLLQSGCKFLVFAHHHIMLDALEAAAARRGAKSVRIDGGVGAEERARRVKEFQTQEEVRVAILGILAAGVGITLTAASLVVFAELHWTPGVLVQAEDRAHRIGQKSSVNIQYLIAKGTVDDVIWQSVYRKVGVVSKMCDGRRERLDVQLCSGGASQGIEEVRSQTEHSQDPMESIREFLAEYDAAAPVQEDVVTPAAVAADNDSEASSNTEDEEARKEFSLYSFCFSRLTGRVHVLDDEGKSVGANVKVLEWDAKGREAFPETLLERASAARATEQFLREWKALTEKEQRQRFDVTLRLPLKKKRRKKRRLSLAEIGRRLKQERDRASGQASNDDSRQPSSSSQKKSRRSGSGRQRENERTHEQDMEEEEEADLPVRVASVHRVVFQPGQLGLRLRSGVVTRVVPQSQAEHAGINVGWILLSIDGVPYEDKVLRDKMSSACSYEAAFQLKMCVFCGEAAAEAESEFCSPACMVKSAPVERSRKRARVSLPEK
eukprot:TRINITY_DN17862_c2_g3_i1.p1 TRINITY_DN17862_c2_g3~~TRINITY_DN17862_c2_g3_i1.p1  ORF type:complete len:1002 (-),score=158.87 TRINITY_DN17862_c2_g3_i1:120-3041(-)